MEEYQEQILEIFVCVKNKIINEFKNYKFIKKNSLPNETSITFLFYHYLTIAFKKDKDNIVESFKNSILNYCIDSINTNSDTSANNLDTDLEKYFNENLIIESKYYNMHEEGKINKSDLGFIIPYPELSYSPDKTVLKRNGILLQAKKNGPRINSKMSAKKNKKGEISDIIHNIKGFYYLFFYDFVKEEKQGEYSFKQISINNTPTALKSIEKKNYLEELDKIINSKEENFLGYKEFFEQFIECKIGTNSEEEIDKYIISQNIPYFEIKIDLSDAGNGLDEIVNSTQNNIVNEDEKVPSKVMVNTK